MFSGCRDVKLFFKKATVSKDHQIFLKKGTILKDSQNLKRKRTVLKDKTVIDMDVFFPKNFWKCIEFFKF